MSKHCNVCQGNVTQQTTTYTVWYKDKLYVIEHVPAWVCERCGETYYDPDVAERIQNMVWSEEAPARVISASVFEWS